MQAAVATRPVADERLVLIMAQDEGRFGRISRPKKCWAPPGLRPLAPAQVVRESMYVFAAVAPAVGKLVTLVLPEANTEMMNLFLEEVSRTFADCFIVMQGGSCGLASLQGVGGAIEYPLDPATCP